MIQAESRRDVKPSATQEAIREQYVIDRIGLAFQEPLDDDEVDDEVVAEDANALMVFDGGRDDDEA
uniref:Uncharacterized protein n=1 Tax=Solanum tuberosum TaxID=4113 RepID=M1DMR6_SOLTU